MAYRPNNGKLPRSCVVFAEDGEERKAYRKVHVRLRNGFCSRAAGHEPWPAAGANPATRWSIEPPGPFDIVEYEVV